MSGGLEVWLRSAASGVHPQLQPAAHSLQQSLNEMHSLLPGLTLDEVNARAGAAAPISFHARHLAGSIDRLLTYARGEMLDEQQREALRLETQAASLDGTQLFDNVRTAIERALAVIAETDAAALDEPRAVGAARLPTTLRGILFHIAEHSLMHSGQMRTTALALKKADAE
jgi:hypothetical protein